VKIISLDEAARQMEIHLPVRVELHAECGAQSKGGYVGVFGGTHRIRVRVGKAKFRVGAMVRFMDESACATLWHELTHAMQCERDFDGNSSEAFEHYDKDIRRRLKEAGLDPDSFGQALGDQVAAERTASKQMFGRSFSPTFDVYEASPWEVEARSSSPSPPRLAGTPNGSEHPPNGGWHFGPVGR
jgi:hypothetical protein